MASDFYTTDDEDFSTHPSTLTPTDASILASAPSTSRRSSGRFTPSSVTPSTPPPIPNGYKTIKTHDEDDGASNVHQFTPSLHASLVSEILSLRRELESKNNFIERLETSLSSSKVENEALQDTLSKQAKESRAVKKQLQSIEDGTLTAIEDLCKERDAAAQANAELKKKLENSQKKLKSREEETKQAQEMWDAEKEKLKADMKLLERKVHISEGRLKAVVEEVVAHEAEMAAAGVDKAYTARPDASVGAQVDEAIMHDATTVTLDNDQNPTAKGTTPQDPAEDDRDLDSRPVGASLADELNFDEESEEEYEKTEGPGASPIEEEEVATARVATSAGAAQYVIESPRRDRDPKPILVLQTDHRIQPGDSVNNPDQAHTESSTTVDPTRGGSHAGSPHRPSDPGDIPGDNLPGSPEGKVKQMVKRISLNQARANAALLQLYPKTYRESVPGSKNYVSTGIQFSPPASPELNAVIDSAQGVNLQTLDTSIAFDGSGQAQKSHISNEHAVPLPTPTYTPALEKEEYLSSQDHEEECANASQAQTDSTAARMDSNDSVSPERSLEQAKQDSDFKAEALFAGQCESVPPKPTRPPPPLPPPTRAPPLPPVTVPSIAIHPPVPDGISPVGMDSIPTGHSIGCQTDHRFHQILGTRNTGTQTDSIRIDKRPVKLPDHLLPSYVTDRLPLASEITRQHTDGGSSASRQASPDPETPSRLSMIGEEKDTSRWTRLKKALLWGPDSEFQDDNDDPALSDDEPGMQQPHRSNYRAPKQSRVFDPPTPVPENEKATISRPHGHRRGRRSEGSRSSIERLGRPANSQFSRLSSHRGIANPLSQHSRTPSFESNASSSNYSKGRGPAPPFAIPIRSSSAGIRSHRHRSQRSPTRRVGVKSSPRLSQESTKPSPRWPPPPTLRKSRSAAVLEIERRSTEIARYQNSLISNQPPFVDNSTQYSHSRRSSEVQRYGAGPTPLSMTSLTQPSVSSNLHTNNSLGATAQPSVVDAITATMIGEWMFKYVRKRASFGKSDQSQDFSKDARHKRWVWLSPYERTIMWSAKQPTSNAALMGKQGRTLAIQSVLDVKDDTPLPKSFKEKVFDRSILVLTPSRALKFTAVSRERHYLWLSALSFLAHHNHGTIDLNILPTAVVTSGQGSNSATTRSHASSIRLGSFNHPRPGREKSSKSLQSSVPTTPVVTPLIDQVQRFSNLESRAADAAFAPSIPRVPSEPRKRSTTNPNRHKVDATARGVGLNRVGSSSNSMMSAGGGSGRSSSAARAAIPASFGATEQSMINHAGVVEEVGFSSGLFASPAGDLHGLDGIEESPRQSTASAEFGGNINFFDAVGLVRMDAFVSPGVEVGLASSNMDGLLTASSTNKAASKSQESFIGPPNILRGRSGASQ